MNQSLSYSFPKSARLLRRRDFQRLAHSGKRHQGQWIIIDSKFDTRPGSCSPPRLGITVSKRFGDAHKRNRFKRIVREAFRLCQHQLPVNLEIIVKPRTLAEKASMGDIQEEIIRWTKV